MADKTPRTQETREAESRQRLWQRPSTLPTPEPKEGVSFRWVRTALLGDADNSNVSMRFREGYTPVKASEFPEFMVLSDFESRFKDNIEVGGLLLCSIPTEILQDRAVQMRQRAADQMNSVDRSYLRESDPRMPVLQPDRKSRVSFGEE